MKKPASIREYIEKDLVMFRPDTNVMSAIKTLIDYKISAAPVVDSDKKVIGIISEIDCIKPFLGASYYNEVGNLVSELMSTSVVTVNAESSLMEVAQKFLDLRFRRFPVVEHGKFIGQISRRDVLRAIGKLRK